MTSWQQWLEHPERVWVRHALFQTHLWGGGYQRFYEMNHWCPVKCFAMSDNHIISQ